VVLLSGSEFPALLRLIGLSASSAIAARRFKDDFKAKPGRPSVERQLRFPFYTWGQPIVGLARHAVWKSTVIKRGI
jgi:hypothetical protein